MSFTILKETAFYTKNNYTSGQKHQLLYNLINFLASVSSNTPAR
jgi:hypothetical protein